MVVDTTIAKSDIIKNIFRYNNCSNLTKAANFLLALILFFFLRHKLSFLPSRAAVDLVGLLQR